MKCPVCEVDLLMSERQAVEIDYCPKCRGVWLDRGELDKIIERTNADFACVPAGAAPLEGKIAYDAPPAGRETPAHSEPDDHRERERYHDHRGHDRDYDAAYDKDCGKPKKKRGSFLADIFEGIGD